MNNVALTKTRASIAPRRVGKNTDNTQTEHNPEQESRAAARKPRDAASILIGRSIRQQHSLQV